jgi:hypothetical protein
LEQREKSEAPTVKTTNSSNSSLHEHLLKIVRKLPDDFEPFGRREHDGADCSCGCKHFLKLAGQLGFDWGVCANAKSPRCGLLTFEHQGCAEFEAAERQSRASRGR